jgi:uncharacterized membrane protein YhhN
VNGSWISLGGTTGIEPENGIAGMSNLLIALSGVILLSVLLYSERKRGGRGLLFYKGALSSLFIVAVITQDHQAVHSYYVFLLTGLVFCLGGDLFLAIPRERMFLFGLASFWFGHLFYFTGFFHLARVGWWTFGGLLVTTTISGVVFFGLKPHLGKLKGPVFLYVLVITLMVAGAWSLLGDENLKPGGRIMVFSGALAFYFSDLFVARNRFIKKEFINRLVGLPLYYTGQFLLAFSVGMLK